MTTVGPGARGRTASRRLNLVEVLVVFAIVAVATTVAAGLLKAAVDQAREARGGVDHGTITAAENLYFALNGRYATIEDLVEDGVLARRPADVAVEVLDDGTSYRIVEGPVGAPGASVAPPGGPAAGPGGLSPPGGSGRSG